MIKLIRKHLLANKVINEYVSKDIPNAIFHEIKPKINIQNYIILKEKPIDMGFVEVYQLDVYVYGKDLTKIISVEKAIKEQLNDVRGDKLIINDDIHIKDTSMLVGGGRQYDESLDRFVSVQFYKISI